MTFSLSQGSLANSASSSEVFPAIMPGIFASYKADKAEPKKLCAQEASFAMKSDLLPRSLAASTEKSPMDFQSDGALRGPHAAEMSTKSAALATFGGQDQSQDYKGDVLGIDFSLLNTDCAPVREGSLEGRSVNLFKDALEEVDEENSQELRSFSDLCARSALAPFLEAPQRVSSHFAPVKEKKDTKMEFSFSASLDKKDGAEAPSVGFESFFISHASASATEIQPREHAALKRSHLSDSEKELHKIVGNADNETDRVLGGQFLHKRSRKERPASFSE